MSTDTSFQEELSQIVHSHIDDGTDPESVISALTLQADVVRLSTADGRTDTGGQYQHGRG